MYIKKITPKQHFKLKIKTTQLLHNFPIIARGQTVSWMSDIRLYDTTLYPNIIYLPKRSFSTSYSQYLLWIASVM